MAQVVHKDHHQLAAQLEILISAILLQVVHHHLLCKFLDIAKTVKCFNSYRMLQVQQAATGDALILIKDHHKDHHQLLEPLELVVALLLEEEEMVHNAQLLQLKLNNQKQLGNAQQVQE
jgi:hypothetical protein